jgi:hypothetical protein
MANSLFELAREKFLGGDLDWDAQTFKAALLDLGTADTGIKAIASSTNATPIVVTATSHGFANGDIVYIGDHATNTAANGVWKIANQATNTFELQRPDGTNAVGNGVGGATGYAVNLGPSVASDFWNDFDGALVGALSSALANKTKVQGVADADDVTFTSVTGNTVEAVAIIRDTGTPSTSEMVALITGRFIVTVAADAASSATTIWVTEPLPATVASQTLAFSNGGSATTVTGTAGGRSLTCSALAASLAAGHRALVVASGSGLPVTPNGGNISLAFDTGANRIFKL